MSYKFPEQAAKVTHCQARSLSYALNQSQEWIAKKTRMATLVMLLGLGGGFWLTAESLTPQIAQAETARADISITRQPDETYDNLVERAKAAALAAAQENFDQDNQVTDVSVMVVAQNQGAIAPVLSLQISRQQWLSGPDPQRWVTYFSTARSLLGFEGIATTTADQPGTAAPAIPQQPEATTPDIQNFDDINSSDPESVIPTPEGLDHSNSSDPDPTTPVTPEQSTDSSVTQTEIYAPTPTEQPESAPVPNFLNPQQPTGIPVVPPDNLQSPTSPDVSPGFPSLSTPTNTPQTPLGSPSPSGSTNNLTPTGIPNNNSLPTPIIPDATVP